MRWKCPRSGGPGQEIDGGIVEERERDNNGWVCDVLVVLIGLEVAQGSRKDGRVRHHAIPLIYLSLLKELLEDPPQSLHELGVHSLTENVSSPSSAPRDLVVAHLVVIVKVNPATKSFNGQAPLAGIAHDNSTALLVVFFDAELGDRSLARYAQLLVDFVFDWQAMGVPAEAALDVIALHGPVPGDDILDGRCQQVAIVWETGRKGRSVVEGISRAPSDSSSCGRRVC